MLTFSECCTEMTIVCTRNGTHAPFSIRYSHVTWTHSHSVQLTSLLYQSYSRINHVLQNGSQDSRGTLSTCLLTHPKTQLLATIRAGFLGDHCKSLFAPWHATVITNVLSVMLLYCGQTVGWINTPLGMEVGLSPGDTVRWRPISPPHVKGHSSPPTFGQCLLWPNGHTFQQVLSFCMCWMHYS